MIRKFPSAAILVFVVGGIIFADWSRGASWFFLTACFVSCVSGFLALERRKNTVAILLFGFGLCFFSAFHFAVKFYDTGPNHISRQDVHGKLWHIYGHVSDWPDLRLDRTDFMVDIDSLGGPTVRQVRGAIILRVTDTTTGLQYGDAVEFFGRIYPVEGATSTSPADYRRHLNLEGVFGIAYMPTLLDVRVDRRNRYALLPVIDNLRDAVRSSLEKNLSPQSAALACGILIGETRNIPVETYRRFRDSGTLHLLAVSGSNVALVLLFFIVLLKPLALAPTRRALALLLVIGVFAMLSYGEPSVVRASLMAALVLLAGLLQRKYNLNNTIATAAVIILLLDPAQLYDIGFQLSFTIAWGLIFIMPRLAAYFRPVYNRWWYRWLVFPLLVSLVAQLCSAGLIAYHFGRVPLISPIANLIVVPLVSVAVVGVLVLMVFHLALPILGTMFGSWLDPVLQLILKLVNLLGSDRLPAFRTADLSGWLVALFYLYLFTTAWSLRQRLVRRLVVVSLLVLVNAALLIMAIAGQSAHPSTTADLFSVPGGVAALIKRSHSQQADLVLTGLAGKAYPIDQRILLPQLQKCGVTTLNTVFVLTARYDALDDIMRLADTLRANRLFVSEHLAASCRDVAGTLGALKPEICPVDFDEAGPRVGRRDPFYTVSQLGLKLVSDDGELILTDRIQPCHLNLKSDADSRVLVIGSIWQTSEQDLNLLCRGQYARIYCSKIVHRDDPGVTHLGPRSDLLPADIVCDLSRTGPVTLTL